MSNNSKLYFLFLRQPHRIICPLGLTCMNLWHKVMFVSLHSFFAPVPSTGLCMPLPSVCQAPHGDSCSATSVVDFTAISFKTLWKKQEFSSPKKVWNLRKYSLSSPFLSVCCSLAEENEAQQYGRLHAVPYQKQVMRSNGGESGINCLKLGEIREICDARRNPGEGSQTFLGNLSGLASMCVTTSWV